MSALWLVLGVGLGSRSVGGEPPEPPPPGTPQHLLLALVWYTEE